MFTNPNRPRGAVEIERIIEHRDTVLRIGLVHDNRLISDQAFSTDENVRIGRDRKDDIVLDDDYSGPTVRFTRHHDGTATVQLPADMRFCLARGTDTPRFLPELVRRGHALAQNGAATVHVPMGSRGRVVLGPYTVLFQVIRRRIRVPMMPGQGLIKRFVASAVADPVWSACLALSILLVGSLATQTVLFQAQTGDYLRDARAPEEPDRGPVYIPVDPIEKEAPPPIKPAAKPVEPDVDSKPIEPVKRPTKRVRKQPKSTATDSADETDRKRNLRPVAERVAKRTIAGAFKGQGATRLFAATDDDSGDTVVARAFNGNASESGDTPGDPGATKLVGTGSGLRLEKVATRRRAFDKRSRSATKVSRVRKEKIVRVKVGLSEPLSGSGGNKDQVARVLRRKNAAVRRCYESALRSDPSLGGKVRVSFVVGTAGTVTSVRIVGASGEFARCIETKFRRIRGLPALSSPASFTQAYVFTKK